MEKITSRLDLNFRFKNLKGQPEPENIRPANELVSELLYYTATQSKDERVKKVNWALKLNSDGFLEIDKNELKQIQDIINTCNLGGGFVHQIDEAIEKAIDKWDEKKKAADKKK